MKNLLPFQFFVKPRKSCRIGSQLFSVSRHVFRLCVIKSHACTPTFGSNLKIEAAFFLPSSLSVVKDSPHSVLIGRFILWKPYIPVGSGYRRKERLAHTHTIQHIVCLLGKKLHRSFKQVIISVSVFRKPLRIIVHPKFPKKINILLWKSVKIFFHTNHLKRQPFRLPLINKIKLKIRFRCL